jgi:CPA1 family monovalent cation:H+ antiporter
MFEAAVWCLVVTAAIAYLNHRYLSLPTKIGVMGFALVLSLVLSVLARLGAHSLQDYGVSLLSKLDFSDFLLQGILSVLLFAGALHVDLSELLRYKGPVIVLSILATVTSTVLVSLGLWAVLPLAGAALPLSYCLIFGALISPTDPIAVMGILKSAGAPQNLEIVISGESLFNDGIGVVLFTLLFSLVAGGQSPTLAHGMRLLLQETGGGLAFGLALGFLTYYILKSIDNYQVEVLITLAAVLGGSALANRLHVSGPLAMVVAGLLIGNHGRELAMSETTRQHLDTFWGLLDEILNSVLFMLIGLEVILVSFSPRLFVAMVAVLVITLLARVLSAGLPAIFLRRLFRGLPRGSWKVLTWSGLRGGISVALALSLPLSSERETVLALTYAVVVFSILVQGLSIRAVVERAIPKEATLLKRKTMGMTS